MLICEVCILFFSGQGSSFHFWLGAAQLKKKLRKISAMPPKLPPSPGKDARLLERSRRGEQLAQQRRLRVPELGGMIMDLSLI